MAWLSPAASYIQTRKPVFLPRETHDDPYDVTLVVEDEKEFKAHRRVLTEASPFFEKLLNSDMREAKEGVAGLEMLTETGLGDILEFIYTGSVQISAEHNAQDLIAMADYLLLPQLKTLAEEIFVRNLAQMLNASNCLSIYFFARRYQCEQLIPDTTKFILANFSTVAKTEDFLNMSFEQVEKWISSDEIYINAEEDVFKIILTWIDRDKNERKKYFADLFRQVRLVYVSRDYLRSDIVTNGLVIATEGCLDRVKYAMMLFDSNRYNSLSVRPRKSLETPVIVVGMQEQILCYFPRKDMWCRLRSTGPASYRVFFHHGQLRFALNEEERSLLRCNRLANMWRYDNITSDKDKVNFRSENEIYALVSTNQGYCAECVSLQAQGIREPFEKTQIRNLSTKMKYKRKSNLEDISFDLGVRVGNCVVSKDNFIDFLGGINFCERYVLYTPINPTNSDGYCHSTSNNTVDIQEARWESGGISACRHLIIGRRNVLDRYRFFERTREVFNETTNEWQLIANLWKTCRFQGFMMCVDGKLHVLSMCREHNGSTRELTIECFDPERSEWGMRTSIPISSPSQSLEQATPPGKNDERKCLIM